MERAAQIDGILSTDTVQTESVPEQTLPPAEDEPEETAAAFAAYADVLGMTAEDIDAYVYGLHESYNTVSINITADNGNLVYVSPSLLEYVKLDPSSVITAPVTGNVTDGDDETPAEELDVLANIKTALAAAKRKELRTCAVYTASSSVTQRDGYEGAWAVDAVIAGELYEMGFDEVMIDGVFSEEEEFDVDSVTHAASYAVYLKEKSEIDVGLVLPEEAILVSSNASIVNTLCTYADFLGMYVSGEGADAEEAYSIAYEEFHSVKGALNAYKVRAIPVTEDEGIAAAVATALRDLTEVGIQFTNAVESPVYSAETEAVTVETEPIDTAYNENANRKDDYINDTEPEEGASYGSDAPIENGNG